MYSTITLASKRRPGILGHECLTNIFIIKHNLELFSLHSTIVRIVLAGVLFINNPL